MNGGALSTQANVSPQQGSVSSATYRWLPPNTDRQRHFRPSGGRMEGLPLSPPSTKTISLSISDSDSRFCLIAGGNIFQKQILLLAQFLLRAPVATMPYFLFMHW